MTDDQIDEEVKRQFREANLAMMADPDLVPYIGPVDLLERFQRGEIVTDDDLLADYSKMVIRVIHRRAKERLEYMLKTTRPIAFRAPEDPK